MIDIRPALSIDAAAMARLLNEIIKIGGTTAIVRPVTGVDIAEWMSGGRRSAWHVAVDDTGDVLGFQWIEETDALPPEAAEIATFVQTGKQGLGIGSGLFEATKQAAKRLGYGWIRANIRADNEGGLIYYQSRGFRDYGVIEGYELENGETVDKRLKRFDLD